MTDLSTTTRDAAQCSRQRAYVRRTQDAAVGACCLACVARPAAANFNRQQTRPRGPIAARTIPGWE